MSDLEPVGNKDVTNAGVRGIGATVGGLGLLILTGVASWATGIVGLALGGITLVFGLGSLRSSSKADKTGGAIAVGAGVLLAAVGVAHLPFAIPLVSWIAKLTSGLAGLGAFGLLGYGIFNLFKFGKGLRSRR
jgi:hypothetical protein